MNKIFHILEEPSENPVEKKQNHVNPRPQRKQREQQQETRIPTLQVGSLFFFHPSE